MCKVYVTEWKNPLNQNKSLQTLSHWMQLVSIYGLESFIHRCSCVFLYVILCLSQVGSVRETQLQGGKDRPWRGGHRAHLPLPPSRGAAAERGNEDRGRGSQEVHHRFCSKSRQGRRKSLWSALLTSLSSRGIHRSLLSDAERIWRWKASFSIVKLRPLGFEISYDFKRCKHLRGHVWNEGCWPIFFLVLFFDSFIQHLSFSVVWFFWTCCLIIMTYFTLYYQYSIFWARNED